MYLLTKVCVHDAMLRIAVSLDLLLEGYHTMGFIHPKFRNYHSVKNIIFICTSFIRQLSYDY